MRNCKGRRPRLKYMPDPFRHAALVDDDDEEHDAKLGPGELTAVSNINSQ